jgi:mRNA interferase YafQ
MYKIKTTNKFEKDLVLCCKRNYNLSLLKLVISTLEHEGKLPINNRTHQLIGIYKDCFECHVKPDWLLFWRQDEENKVIELVRTGTHSDLF